MHEYGGGAWTVADGALYFSNDKDRRLYKLERGANAPEPITPEGPFRYADGVIEEVGMTYGGDVRDWWQVMGEPTKARSRTAWVGGNEAARAAGKGVTLYEMTWDNPRVGVEVVSVDFESAMGGSAPFLVGVTVDP